MEYPEIQDAKTRGERFESERYAVHGYPPDPRPRRIEAYAVERTAQNAIEI